MHIRNFLLSVGRAGLPRGEAKGEPYFLALQEGPSQHIRSSCRIYAAAATFEANLPLFAMLQLCSVRRECIAGRDGERAGLPVVRRSRRDAVFTKLVILFGYNNSLCSHTAIVSRMLNMGELRSPRGVSSLSAEDKPMLLSVHFKSFALALALLLLARGPCTAAASPDLEEVMAVEATNAGVTLTVPTGGCTQKSDFEVSSSPIKNGQASVEFRRLFRDTCKGFFPEGLKLQFTWADLKLPEGTKLTVKNPIEPPLGVLVQPKKIKRHHHSKPRHKRMHRHRGHHAKVHARAHRRTSIHARGGVVRFCHEFPHSRQCPHLKHARVHRRHRRAHCR